MRVEFYCYVCEAPWEADLSPQKWGPRIRQKCPTCGDVTLVASGECQILDVGIPLAVVLFAMAGDRILAISRKDDHAAFGLPGGKVDPSDGPTDEIHREATLKKALVREVREEVGVSLSPQDLRPVFQCLDPTGFWNVCFTVSAETVTTASTQPGEGVVQWVDWDTLFRGPFAEFNRQLQQSLS